MKDMNDAIIFRSRDFKKAESSVSSCHQELRSPNFDKSRFRSTDSIEDTHREKALLNT